MRHVCALLLSTALIGGCAFDTPAMSRFGWKFELSRPSCVYVPVLVNDQREETHVLPLQAGPPEMSRAAALCPPVLTQAPGLAVK